jgi:hypothetical protein
LIAKAWTRPRISCINAVLVSLQPLFHSITLHIAPASCSCSRVQLFPRMRGSADSQLEVLCDYSCHYRGTYACLLYIAGPALT